ncbi:MAG: peptidylprolyl isomerase [Bacteroidia bacterium]|nr:peptidylprolyl isomerase [Bacteroidia bacterium]MDW8015735.1 peptidylprolyl isomerase [Bacteroidia bacterium]
MSFTEAQVRLEGIAAVVGDELILESQLLQQYAYLKQIGTPDDGGLYCQTLEGLIIQKLLVVRAKIDSLKVTDEQVERELDRRIQILVSQLGSPEAIVEIYGKPLPLLKQELRNEVRNQILAEEMRQKITADVRVTPKEVRDFYISIPKDSLPFIPAEVELSQIVFWAKPSLIEREAAKEKLEQIRHEIIAGKMEFATAARTFSQDVGSARQGGDLGEFVKGQMVPEFERVAFSIPIGEVSPVFESPYGFHILLVEKRVGNKVRARHILIQPSVTEADVKEAGRRLEVLRGQILRDSISFTRAAIEFSEDIPTKQTGGRLIDQETGAYRLPLDKLDPDLYFIVDELKEGEISQVQSFTARDGRKGVRIVWLQRRYPPHRATLEMDYERFAEAALQLKKQEAIERWLLRARRNVTVEIRDPRCAEALAEWEQAAER